MTSQLLRARSNHLILVSFFIFIILLKLLVLLFTDFSAKPAIEVIHLQHISLSNLDFHEVVENFTFSIYSVVTYPFYLLMGDSILATRVFNVFVNFFILVALSKYTNRRHGVKYLLLILFYPALVYYSMYELRDVFLSFVVLFFVLRVADAKSYRDIIIISFFLILMTITRPELSAGLVIALIVVSSTSNNVSIKSRLTLLAVSLLLLSFLFFEVGSTLSGSNFLDYYQARANIQYINGGAGSSILDYKDIVENGLTLSVMAKGIFFLYFPIFNPDLGLGKKLFYSTDSLIFLYIFIKSLMIKIDKESINRYRVIQWFLLSNIFLFSFFISNYMNFLRVKMPLVVGLIGVLVYFSSKYKKT